MPRHRPRPLVVDRAVAIVEEIMTQHWDHTRTCTCWVCHAGRHAGCKPRAHHLNTYRGRVWVDPALHEPKHWIGPGWGTE